MTRNALTIVILLRFKRPGLVMLNSEIQTRQQNWYINDRFDA